MRIRRMHLLDRALSLPSAHEADGIDHTIERLRQIGSCASEYLLKTPYERQLAGRISELQEQVVGLQDENETLRQQSAYDSLIPEVLSRSGLQEYLRRTPPDRDPKSMKTTLFYVDVNNLKVVNDSARQHDVGDSVLRALGASLGAAFPRESDAVSRVGGDEFVVVVKLVDTEDDMSEVFAEDRVAALRQDFRERLKVIEGLGTRERSVVGLAVGIASTCGGPDGLPYEELIQQADVAMYDDKKRLKTETIT